PGRRPRHLAGAGVGVDRAEQPLAAWCVRVGGRPMTLLSGGTEADIEVGGVPYRVHTFTSSGTLTVIEGGEVEYLVHSGGGGGGSTAAGGGGGAGSHHAGTITISSTVTV